MAFCEALLTSPSGVSVRPGQRHFAIFAELCRSTSAKGNAIPDAFHAALAMEHGATWVTTDRKFAAYPGLSWRHPFER